MATISHTSQISRQATTSGTNYTSSSDGARNGWDHKLNSLLEDLHGSVIPANEGRDGRSTEYREYRMTSSTRNNDEPPSTTEEKWIEYGTAGGHPHPVGQPSSSYLSSLESSRPTITPAPIIQSSSTSSMRSLIDSRNRNTTNYSLPRDDTNFGQSHLTHTHSQPQMEFIDPSNTTISLRSGQISPLPPIQRSSPKVEKKEFYSKASYTTLIKGGQAPPQEYTTLQDHVRHPTPPPPLLGPQQHYRNDNEFTREYTIQEPLYTTPPKITKPPTVESPSNSGLKTPPLVRKFLQQSESYGSHTSSHTHHEPKINGYDNNNRQEILPLTGSKRPIELPITKQHTDYKHTTQQHTSSYNRDRDVPNYDDTYIDDRNKNIKFYTSTTRTETKENSDNIIKKFPSQGNVVDYRSGEPPKRLDDLLATFDESYVETSRIVGDGGGPHRSHPYGPGTHSIEQPQRVVRIDESRNVENEISRRNVSQNNAVEQTRNVTGPPVYYPIRDNNNEPQIYKSTNEETELMKGKGKAKSKMERNYKAKEVSKSSHSEKGGGGALPVPVCLPVCCAAPCVIM